MTTSPIDTTAAIREAYLGYLATTFRLEDPALQDEFRRALREPDRFVKGPILEATPSFRTGSTIRQLVEEGLLSRKFLTLNSPALPVTRPLYEHQETSIRKLVSGGRNIVVATGTGSGKTETFLVPILEHLFRQHEEGTLGPGVRALLLYPMNALANDQLARLRTLLGNCREVTFGRYTGETERSHSAALTQYQKTHKREPLPNELISREQMWGSPPHILLTNYAMLEYLLLRPSDSVFFDGEHARHWRFIVIDESHTYTGAKGIEMAMLLRRLKDRVVDGAQGKLRCVATSATLGRGRSDFPAIAAFARRLFGEEFEWVEADSSRQDVVDAARISLVAGRGGRWGAPHPDLYRTWKNIVDDVEDDRKLPELRRTGLELGVLSQVAARAEEAARSRGETAGWRVFLYEVLKGDERLQRLQEGLESGPRFLTELAPAILGDAQDSIESLVALVDLANQARAGEESRPLLPARYHVFASAIEGAYVSLAPADNRRRLFLERRASVHENGREYPVFEVATCRQCGAMYIVGSICEDENGKQVLRQPRSDGESVEYYLLDPHDTGQDTTDEDEEVGFPGIQDDLSRFDRYILCGSCGAVDRAAALFPPCECGPEGYHRLIRVPARDGRVFLCPACGKRNPQGMVWRFTVGTDAAASVLATALYQQLAPARKKEVAKAASESTDSWASTVPSPWGTTWQRQEHPGASRPGTGEHGEAPSGERRLLIFSDSRQDAAFFAPYLNRTYGQILRRRLILRALEEHRDDVLADGWRLQDLVEPVRKLAAEWGLFSDSSLQEQRAEVWKWVMQEFLALDRRISLEGLGLLGFVPVRPQDWVAPRPLLKPPWGLTEEEAWTLFQVLLDTLRSKGAVVFPDYVSPQDEAFAPRNRELYFRAHGSSPAKGILSWNPSSGDTAGARTNSRLDYLTRLAGNLGSGVEWEACRDALKNIWDGSLALESHGSCWRHHFAAVSLPGEGVVYRLRYNVWSLRPTFPGGEESATWYICDKCHSLTLYNIRGTCPTYRCRGRLHPCRPSEVFRDNHYYRLYLNSLPVRMRAEEHTAQLTSEAAAELQNRFVEGDVNVLSCSTTFELGVDVGELEAVFMRNMPPSAANYIQRAGRAGRRTDSTAFALTFAQRRSHDLAHYREPWRMVSGKIMAPHFKLENAKIVRRHVYATALAAFWRGCAELFGTVESFFFNDGHGRCGPDRFREYLDSRPRALLRSLKRIVPEELHQELDLDGWGWARDLFEGENAVLRRVHEEVEDDVRQLEMVREELFRAGKPQDHLLRLIMTIKRKDLIGFLSSRNVIPKYGFPVDVVELQLTHHGEEARNLQLERDLRIALSEYAPSGQVVAGGKVWTSRYIKRLPQREWERYRYAICNNCQNYVRVRAELGPVPDKCPVCCEPFGRSTGVFIVPAFGFVASADKPASPGEEKPEKTYTTRVHYSGEGREEDSIRLEMSGTVLVATPIAQGRLAVINHAGLYGFKVCRRCGYAVRGDEPVPSPHRTPWGGTCLERLEAHLSLGHEFETDILKLVFEGYADRRPGFWFSMLYALLEGASMALDIERQDIDGCLYPLAGNHGSRALLLFDDVPGGAGHVRRLAQREALVGVLRAALERLAGCECGGPEGRASCYGCLRNYRNQFCHDILERRMVVEFLKQVLQ
ncbi:MAG: DEAD/DEAH box helicase [Firmicutes bacterium]|nr:DEAD/DEAH box helicase [Bacillota bacterium]